MEFWKINVVQTFVTLVCFFLKGGRSQPYYYEEGPVYYPEFSPSHEYYQLENLQYGRGGPYEAGGSMRALGGTQVDSDITTSRYDVATSNDYIARLSSESPNLLNTQTPRTYLDGYKQEKRDTTTYHHNLSKDSVSPTSTTIHETSNKNLVTQSTTSDKKLKPSDTTTPGNFKIADHNRKPSERPDKTFPKTGWTSAPPTANTNQVYSSSTTEDYDINISLLQTTPLQNLGNDVTDANSTLRGVATANSTACDVKTHGGCDVIHYERCNPETRHCQCLNGFLRENVSEGTGACKAVKFYHGHVTLSGTISDDQFSAAELQTIKDKLLTLIHLSFEKKGVDGFLDLEIRSVENQGHQLSLSFELGMDKGMLPGQENIQHLLSQDVSLSTDNGRLLDTAPGAITTHGSNISASLFSPLIEVNPCVNEEYNHCSGHATCTYQKETVSCQCSQGYEDLSPSLYRLPGEVCIEKCKCHNGGLCVDVDVLTGKRQCSCLNWYFGSKCQINGKELLLICCCSIGSLILLGLTMCCCYYGCAKHRDNTARSRMFPFTPDINILKLPRVWMDTASFHDDLSPQNNRRMSVASERNPYFEGFVMEDIPMGTLQRHPETSTPYYPTPLAHCPATISSHSFYRY